MKFYNLLPTGAIALVPGMNHRARSIYGGREKFRESEVERCGESRSPPPGPGAYDASCYTTGAPESLHEGHNRIRQSFDICLFHLFIRKVLGRRGGGGSGNV